MKNEAWNRNLPQLKAFVEKNGHCKVPYVGETRSMAKWLNRIKKNSNNLEPERRAQLISLGFDWSSQTEKEDMAWNGLYQKLVAYKDAHGNCEVPQKDPELGAWVANLRKRAKMNKLRNDRKELLRQLNFCWEKNSAGKRNSSMGGKGTRYDEKWQSMFASLKEYKDKFGNCEVPYNYLENTSLGLWVQTQRRVFHKRTYFYGESKVMVKDRKDLLVSIGFHFKSDTYRLEESSKQENQMDVGEEVGVSSEQEGNSDCVTKRNTIESDKETQNDGKLEGKESAGESDEGTSGEDSDEAWNDHKVIRV